MVSRVVIERLVTEITTENAKQIEGFKKSTEAANSWAQKQREAVNVALKAAAAATAGVAALTYQTVQSAKEITQLSQLSNASAENFQRYAAGARTFGIEQEKLADIFKDTTDRVGDFLQTGGGPMADFFENIAPKVGVTAEEFRNLSGPQALELFVSSLERAGVSANEMTFFMEAMASDSTLLLPLLKDNAAGFRLLGDEAQNAGAIMSDRTIDAAKDLSAVMFLVEQSSKGVKSQIAAQLLPTLSDLAVQFSDVAKDGGVAASVAEVLDSSIKGVVATAVGAASSIKLVGKAIGGYMAVVAAVPRGFDAVRQTFNEVKFDLKESAEEAGAAINEILSAGESADGAGQVEGRIKEISNLLNGVRSQAQGGAVTSIVDTKSVESTIAALETQALMVDQSSTQAAIYKLELDGASESQLEYARSLYASIDGFKAYQEEAKRAADIQREIAKIENSTQGESQRVEEEYEKKIEFLRRNIEDQEHFASLETKLLEQKNDQILKIEQRVAQERAAMQYNQARLITEGFASGFDALSGLAKEFAGEQSDIYKGMFAVSKGFAIAESTVKIIQGIANAAALSYPANLGAMASVAASTANLVTQIEGVNYSGAYDKGGYIPAGSFGIVGEYGPEFVSGPANVTSRKKTSDILTDAANMSSEPKINFKVEIIESGNAQVADISFDDRVLKVMLRDSETDGDYISNLQSRTNLQRYG